MSEVKVLTPREVASLEGDVEALNEALAPFVPDGGRVDSFRIAVCRYVRSLDSMDAAKKSELWDAAICAAAVKSPTRTAGSKKNRGVK